MTIIQYLAKKVVWIKMIKRKMPVILLIGESGSGKNTVQDNLERLFGCVPLLSYTTRPKRTPDENTHTFVTMEEFEQIIKNETVVAFTNFDGNLYCATNKQLEQSDVYIIDIKGLQKLLDLKFEKAIDIPFVTVYLQVPEEERIKRMKKRGDSIQAIKQRIKHDRIAFEFASAICDYTINNIDSIVTAKMIYNYVCEKMQKESSNANNASNDSNKQANKQELEKIYDIEREIISKLCSIQTLMKMLNPNVDRITMEIKNCYESMLNVESHAENSNDVKVTGISYRYSDEPKNKDEIFSLTENYVVDFFTQNNNNNNIKLLITNNMQDKNGNNITVPDIRIK